MLRQLPQPPSPPLSPSQDVEATQLSACGSSAVAPSERAEDSQVFRVQLAQDTNIDETAFSQENTASASSQERASLVSNQDDVRGDESEEDEDEPLDDSNDEDWSPDEGPDDVEVVTGESDGSEVEEDISINLIDNDLRQCVTDLITGDECEKGCLKGKSRELEWLTCSLRQMTKTEKTTCILTLLGVLMQTDTATRRRGMGEREKFHYYLPFVGQVCLSAFAHCLGVKPLTIQRYKRRVREGNIAAKEHGNKLNKNASTIDAVWLVKWFEEFAAEVGEVVPVRVRAQKTKDGVVNKYYSHEDYTLLPATFTWDVLYDEMHKFVALGLHVNEPAPSTFRKLLSIHCPKIKIRSAQTNVCDLCTVYQTRMRHNATADQTEELGKHTESARRMRREYKKDRAAVHSEDKASSDLAVIVMDFSQNLTIPSVTCTPSQWYFCSLLAVNVFGIFFENTGTQTNYVYDEFTSGKGSDQINSMLQHFIRTVVIPNGKKHLVVYADNYTGQNKNNHVIKFFLALVHIGVLERGDYKFFVKGHTKNSCDRGFGHIRKHVSRQDCWTMDHIISAVNNSATSNTTVHISRGNVFFKSYKPVVTELYKNLTGVQQYQIFSMVKDQPGVVLCRKGPDDEATSQDLRRNVDGVTTDDNKVDRMFTHFLEDLNPPPLNSEKMLDLHNKIHPYVPDEFQDDPIYAKPSELQQEDAKAAKQARREHRASMAAAAKANQDRRGREVQDESRPTPKKARK